MNRQRRNCENSANTFCYVCGEFTTKSQRKPISKLIKTAYKFYFGCQLGEQDKQWAPHLTCIRCYVKLTQWLQGKNEHMPFAIPMVWREPTNHHDDCYFCMTNVTGFSSKNKNKIVYPNIPSAMRPVPHGEDLPVPLAPASWQEISSSEEDCSEAAGSSKDDDFFPEKSSGEPHLISQVELNDLVRELYLSKQQAELLASRLKEWNFLEKDTKISYYRNRNKDLMKYFTKKDLLCSCCNVNGLMAALGIDYNASDWRLFIDSSKASLKAVLLHNSNKNPSVPVAHAVGMKETYESMSLILKSVNYQAHLWKICGDLKVIGLLLGLQGGFTKYCCFLCLWDSRATNEHYNTKIWPKRGTFIPGQKNIAHAPLVSPQDVFLPALHIKLGLMKNFVKALNKEGDGFKYLKDVFTKLSDAKVKEGIFVGPDIRKLLNDAIFDSKLNSVELLAWKSFKDVVHGFLGNNKAENSDQLVENLLVNYRNLGCRMSLKIHFLHSHLDFFPPNLGAVSDEQGERFHQDVLQMERRYQGKWDESMMSDYCWFLLREDSTSHKRKK